jgi:acyl-CoA thioesterase FadM
MQRDADSRHPECANAGSTGASPRAALDAVPPGAFVVPHTVLESETSALVPHANNVAILGWIDLVASLHGAACGAAREDLGAAGRMWFVARHEIDYLAESFVGDALLFATWTPKVGRTSLVRETRIVRAADRATVVRATSRWAHVDLATRRPAPIADAVRTALLASC